MHQRGTYLKGLCYKTFMLQNGKQLWLFRGSGCGSVGRAVNSDTRGPCSNLVLGKFYMLQTEWKEENWEKEAVTGPIFKLWLVKELLKTDLPPLAPLGDVR